MNRSNSIIGITLEKLILNRGDRLTLVMMLLTSRLAR